ncbi:MFS transporter [Ammonicoccus fulvus]|uniref:MFS transporter n=1 Tax=Ammonicoccus fulvus TaxID=3138240 RepID=A0ABZ3FV67_9ACTN
MTALASPAGARCAGAMFATNGLVIGAYAASLPLLRARLGLSEVQLPVLLLCVGVFAIAAMQIAGRLVDRVGARPVVLVGFPALAVAALILGLTPSFPLALVGGALLGLGNGTVDIAMNAFGVRVEQARERPIMSLLHALWSLGNLAGAALVLLAGLGLRALTHGGNGPETLLAGVLGLVACITLFTTARLARHLPATPPVETTTDAKRRGRIPPIAWLLGVMAIGFGLAEGTAYDWSSLHVTDVAGVSPEIGAIGLTVTAAFMVLIRLVGDRLVERFGRRAIVRFGGLCAALGFVTTGLTQPLPLLLLGWALVGFGVGMIAPQVYAIAGHIGGGRVLAVVVTFGYATFLAGPAVIGALIGAVGIQHAMLVPGAMCLVLAALSLGMPGRTNTAR